MSSSQNHAINPPFTLTTRKVIMGMLVVLSVILVFYLIYHFRSVVMLVITGIVISISMTPVVDWLHQHKLTRSLSVILIYLGLLLLIIGIIFLVVPQTINQMMVLTPRFESFYSDSKTALENSTFPFIRQWGNNLPASLNSFFTANPLGAEGSALSSITWTFNMALSILSALFTLIVVLLLGFYWTLEEERIEYAFLLLMPIERRDSIREVIQELKNRIGGFVRGQGLLGLAIGVMTFIAYSIVGLPSVLSLAFLAGVFELIPVIGPTLGAIPALLVALTYSPSKVLLVILVTVLIQELENNLLAPRVMKKTVGVNPIVTILSIIAFGSMFGFTGVLMAIPLAAVMQVIIDRLLLHPEGSIIEVPAGRDRMSKLKYETQEFVQDIRSLIRRKEAGAVDEDIDQIEDAIESIAIDLECLLAQPVDQDNSP